MLVSQLNATALENMENAPITSSRSFFGGTAGRDTNMYDLELWKEHVLAKASVTYHACVLLVPYFDSVQEALESLLLKPK